MIELKKITESNMDEIINLSISENQKELSYVKYVDNLRCIANAYAINANGEPATAYGIYAGDTPVGFLMYIYAATWDEYFVKEPFYNKECYFVYNFMIDERYQGKGYGKLAFEKMLVDIKTMPHGKSEYTVLFVKNTNTVAKKLYVSLGFVEAIPDGDGIFMYKNI